MFWPNPERKVRNKQPGSWNLSRITPQYLCRLLPYHCNFPTIAISLQFPAYCHITAISLHKVIRGVKFSILLHCSIFLDLSCRTDLGRNDILYYAEQRLACHPCRKRWLIFSHTMGKSGDGVFIIIFIRGSSLAVCLMPRNIKYILFFLPHFVSSGCGCWM
jgi:hypothetical protein